MTQPAPPDYDGRGLVNLIAELETAVAGHSPSPGLDQDLRAFVREARAQVLVLFDGFGSHQLSHPNAADLSASHAGDIDAPFPSTTTVSLATIATGLTPSQHGLVAYKMWMPDVGVVVNTIHMTTRWGETVPGIDYEAFLPSPNLWERLSSAGIEPIVVQPGNFERTPLTRTLYRGARFEGYWNPDEAVAVTTDVAARGDRFVLLYVPHVDFAAHVAGQASEAYEEAVGVANTIWRRLVAELPTDVGLTGTADHGHVDIEPSARLRFDDESFPDTVVSEDGRVLFIHGDPAPILEVVGPGAVHLEAESLWWGPPPHHRQLEDRTPDSIIFLPPDTAVLSRHSNNRLVGYHGGVTAREREIPLLSR